MVEKRRSPRVPTEKGTGGRLKATVPIVIVNVSRHGMLFEVSSPLRPGAIYDLKANLSSFALSAQVRIARCRAGGWVEDGKGGRVLLFQAGAELMQLDDVQFDELKAYVERNLRQKTPSSATLRVPTLREGD